MKTLIAIGLSLISLSAQAKDYTLYSAEELVKAEVYYKKHPSGITKEQAGEAQRKINEDQAALVAKMQLERSREIQEYQLRLQAEALRQQQIQTQQIVNAIESVPLQQAWWAATSEAIHSSGRGYTPHVLPPLN